ncbi:Ankyrin repeat domain-containing protein 54 [Hondaea fermentalgiana]|uniref:Ankyrin repeat domain-containing protein 54 n=1 Tax=Hondaea fermentalgiana TaxID=2315210 RepID=A0A2R5GJS0_9STRA|nr:Ankyrin repeat domain-containing protein 54 [Hondaea fermentalgiana]|eukprot:GBG31130.1 Ankyrin repeat domain-containing protein 54 [Hondaea fermentalgiana]
MTTLPSLQGGASVGAASSSHDVFARGEDEDAETAGDLRAVLLSCIREGNGEQALAIAQSGKVLPQKHARVKPGQAGIDFPLEVAAAFGNQQVVAALLEKGFAAEHTKSLIKAGASEATTSADDPSSSSGSGGGGQSVANDNDSRLGGSPSSHSISHNHIATASSSALGAAMSSSTSSNRFQPTRPRSMSRKSVQSSSSYSSGKSRGRISRGIGSQGNLHNGFSGGSGNNQSGRVSNADAPRHVHFFRTQPRSRPKPGIYSPLHWACYKGHLGIVCLLLRYGFDPSSVDTDGNTALHLAATACSETSDKDCQHAVIIEVLLSENVDIFARNMFGNRALQLATDARAKLLLQRAEQDDRTRSGLLSLSRIIQAEETLSKLLNSIFRDNAHEEENAENGHDIFATRVSSDRADAAAPSSSVAMAPLLGRIPADDVVEQTPEEARAKLEMQRAAQIKASRTDALTVLTISLRRRIHDLAKAVDVAIACKVNKNLLALGKRTLRELTHRQHCETASLKMLGDLVDESNVVYLRTYAGILRKAREVNVARHVFLRTSRVYLYMESKMRLQTLYTSLIAREMASEEIPVDLVWELNASLQAFVQRRIYFGARKPSNLLQDPSEMAHAALSGDGLPVSRSDPSTASGKKGRGANGGGGKRGKKGNGGRKGKKADASDLADGEQKSAEELAAEAEAAAARAEAARAEALFNEDPDDFLMRTAGALLLRLRIEVEFTELSTKTFAKSDWPDSAAHIAALEGALHRLDELALQCEALTRVDCGATVSEDILLAGLARSRQLQRDLKTAKRNLADKEAQSEAGEDDLAPKASKGKKRGGKGKN